MLPGGNNHLYGRVVRQSDSPSLSQTVFLPEMLALPVSGGTDGGKFDVEKVL